MIYVNLAGWLADLQPCGVSLYCESAVCASQALRICMVINILNINNIERIM